MGVRRIVANIPSAQTEAVRTFYEGVIGLRQAMDLGWVQTYVSPTNPTAQLTVIPGPEPSGLHPNLSIEVDDVDAVYAQALEHGVQIVYPITDEPWGVRRFFVIDPNGWTINVVGHRAATE